MSSDAKAQNSDNFAIIVAKDNTNPDTTSSRDSQGGKLSDATTIEGKNVDKTAANISDGSIRTSVQYASISNNDKNNNDGITEEVGHGDDNNNLANRTMVMRRQIDPKRLKNSGLSLQIAQTLHQKSLQKQQQQQQQHHHKETEDSQLLINKREENDKPTKAMNVSKITTSAVDMSSVVEIRTSDPKSQKSMMTVLSASKVLSVPKITITSPPCDNDITTLRENKCERLEDVKRILNRQILSRKLSNNAANSTAITSPLISHMEQSPSSSSSSSSSVTTKKTKMTTTLQIPPQTTIKSIRKGETPPSTTTIPATTITNVQSPLITVRKFHTIASPEMIVKATTATTDTLPTQTLQQQQQQQQSAIFPTTMPGGTIIRPIIISSSTGSALAQGTYPVPLVRPVTPSTGDPTGSNIITIPLSTRTLSTQFGNVQAQQQRSSAHPTTQALIRPVIVSADVVRMQTPQFVTVRPITTMSRSAVLSRQDPQNSPKTSLQAILKPKTTSDFPGIQRKQFPTNAFTVLSNDMQSNNNLATAMPITGTRFNKIVPTISTSKPQVFEIPVTKHQSEQKVESTAEQTPAKKPNIMKASLYCKTMQKNGRSSQITTRTTVLSPKIASSEINPTDNSKLSGSIMGTAPEEQPILPVHEQKSTLMKNTDARSFSKTEDIPIVLENKLLKPGEHIDLKGLRLPRGNIDDVPTKSNKSSIQQKSFIETKNTTGEPVESAQFNRKTIASKKMHVIISNEKLKSAKVDMAELAKKVLQRATKTPVTPAELSRAALPVKLPTKKAAKRSTTSDSIEDELPKIKFPSPTKPSTMESMMTPKQKQKPLISKASLAVIKNDRNQQPTRQKALLREKVLAFCGLKNDAHVSLIKEYPKTVEIVDDEDNTDDNSGPTAVDFIASLAMLKSSNSAANDPNERRQDTIFVDSPSNKLESKKITKKLNEPNNAEKINDDIQTKKMSSGVAKMNDKLATSIIIQDNSTEQAVVSTSKMLEVNYKQNFDAKNLPDEAISRQTNRDIRTEQGAMIDGDVALQGAPESDLSVENRALQENVVNEKSMDRSGVGGKIKTEALRTAKESELTTVETTLSLDIKTMNTKVVDIEMSSKNDVSTKDNDAETNIETPKELEHNELSTLKMHVSDGTIKIDKDCSSSPKKPDSNITPQEFSTANSTPKTSRKRIGIRNAPINLIARKKPVLKKPLTNEAASSSPDKVNDKLNIPINSKGKDLAQERIETVEEHVSLTAKNQAEVVENVEIVEKEEKTQAETNLESAPKNLDSQKAVMELLRTPKNTIKTKEEANSFHEIEGIFEIIEETSKEKAGVLAVNTSTEFKQSTENNVEQKNLGHLDTIYKASPYNNTTENETENSKKDSMNVAASPQSSLCLVPAVAVKQLSAPTDCVMSINLEANKEKSQKNVSPTQKKVEQQCVEQGITILATVAFTDGSAEFSNAAKESISTVQTQPSLPEVGTIIDMNTYRLEKSNAEIIVEQNIEFNDKLDKTSSPEAEVAKEDCKKSKTNTESETQSEKSVIKKGVFETTAKITAQSKIAATLEGVGNALKPNNSMDGNDDSDDTYSCPCPADVNDYSDNDDSLVQVINRKRLRRKRPISALLSTSESEDQTDEGNRALSRSSRKSTVRILNEENSNESASVSASANIDSSGLSTERQAVINSVELSNKTANTILIMKPKLGALLSPQSLTKTCKEFIYTSPFVTAADRRRNIPLKKRWELSQQKPSHDETDITDDTSPAADDDTMDNEGSESNLASAAEVKSNFEKSSVAEINQPETISKKRNFAELESIRKKNVPNEATMCVEEQKLKTRTPNKRSSLSSDTENKSISPAKTLKVVKFDISSSSSASARKSSSKLDTSYSSQQTQKMPPASSTTNRDEETDEVLSSRKRSRKLNTSITDSTSHESDEDQYKSTLGAQFATQISSTPLPRKRGRPPKKAQKHDNTPTENLEMPAQKKRIRQPSRQSVITKERSISPQKETVKLEESAGSTADSLVVVGVTAEVNIPIKKKRGRKPRASIEVTSASARESSLDPTLQEEIFVPTPKSGLNFLDDDAGNTTTEKSLTKTTKLEIPPRKKRGRKPREKSDENSAIACEISFDNQMQKLQKSQETNFQDPTTTTPMVELKAESSTTSASKKRGRKPRVIVASETEPASISSIAIGQETPGQLNDVLTPKARGRKRHSVDLNDFNPRLLLIRKREQLDTDEILTVADSCEAGEGPLQCGLCLARTTEGNWHKHLGEHYGVGWILNKEPAVNTSARSKVLSRMNAYFKQKETTLRCRLCENSYRSSLGLLIHFESCGLAKSRIDCPNCGRSYTKLSFDSHQRTCTTTKTKADEESNKKEHDLVLNNTGRFKRASQIKAETKLKNLTKALSENEASFEPKNFIQFREMDGKGFFYCTLCPLPPDISFEIEADAINHVVRKHKQNENPDKSAHGDSSDFDGSGEEAQESEESSTDTDFSVAESDCDKVEANQSITAKKKSRIRKHRKVYEAKRTGGLPAVYTPRCSDAPGLVLKKWKQFIGSNYTLEALYPYAIPIYGGETMRALDLHSAKNDSMKFTISQKHKPFHVLGKPANPDWQQLRRFQSIDQRSSDKLIYLGAPIKSLAWAPVPETISEQYLVVSCRKSLTSFTRFKSPKSEGAALLFIYKIPNDNLGATKKDFQAKIHYALCVQNGPVHTLAFLPSGGYDAAANRLGLLAVGTATSDIKIYALPIQPAQCEKLKIEEAAANDIVRVVSLKPAFELTLDASASDTQQPSNGYSLIATQCVHICWSEFSGHQHIFASFANGFIGIWEIKEPKNPIYNLNCHFRDGERRCFTPLQYFYFGEKFIKGFGVHYDTNGPRWLALQGYARKLVVYDIRSFSYPVPVREESLKNIARDIDWSPIWEAFASALCDAIPNHGRSIIAINPASVTFAHSRMEYMLAGVSTLHYNPWQSVYGVGVDNGDILFVNTREMNQDLQVLLRPKRNVLALSVLDIKRLDGEELIRPESKDWQMYEKDYQEKYGLVFAQTAKLTSDERNAYLSAQRIPPPYVERYMRISILRWNLNALGKRYVAIGYENGFLRLIRFKRETYFD